MSKVRALPPLPFMRYTMTKITIDIDSCKDCPLFKQENNWSSDGWDNMWDWMCYGAVRQAKGKKKGTMTKPRKIQASVEWHEANKIKVPDWCPKR